MDRLQAPQNNMNKIHVNNLTLLYIFQSFCKQNIINEEEKSSEVISECLDSGL